MAEWPAVILRFALYSDLALLFGVSAYGYYSRLTAVGRESTRAVVGAKALLPLAGVGFAATFASLLQMTASMSGGSITELDLETLEIILRETSLGFSFVLRLAALLTAMVLLWRSSPLTPRRILLTSSAAAVALASLAWTGHGAASEGVLGYIHLSADILHLLAGGAWVGAIAVLLLLVWRARGGEIGAVEDALSALSGFSWAGTAIVGSITLSGLVNTWVLVGAQQLQSLWQSLYGQLLLAKLLLFILMLGLASANRYRLTPALELAAEAEGSQRAVRALRTSIAVEGGLALIILVLVAWLGILEPPASSAA